MAMGTPAQPSSRPLLPAIPSHHLCRKPGSLRVPTAPAPLDRTGGMHLATSTSGLERKVKICFSPGPRPLTVSMGPPPSGYSTLMKYACPAVHGEDRAECSGPSWVPCEQEQAMVKAGAGPACCVHCP